ncbi:MAG: hypothetical protein LUH51_02045 [Firmicutes bacterium]|nr:hypothetical protein [Bacillota bacterium]
MKSIPLDNLSSKGSQVLALAKSLGDPNKDCVVSRRDLALGGAVCALSGLLIGIFLIPAKEMNIGLVQSIHPAPKPPRSKKPCGCGKPAPEGEDAPEEEPPAKGKRGCVCAQS